MNPAWTKPRNSPLTAWLSNRGFILCLAVIGSFYVFMILALLFADAQYTSPKSFGAALNDPDLQFSIRLSLITCTVSAIISLWIAVPIGYLMARIPAPRNGLWYYVRSFLDSILDIPIVLPPLVIGLSLLILFQTRMGKEAEIWFEKITGLGITYEVPGIILAQVTVSCAFAVRVMRATFEHLNPRQEQVALTLGCTRSQAFWWVVIPDAKRGILTAGTLAWARALGEFGPILVFAGATRGRTEVMPTSVFLELTVGHLESAVAISLLMVGAAALGLILVRYFGTDPMSGEGRQT